MASADLLLHPVRLRVVQAFLGGRALTTSQLVAELGDVPPGSLYRHVALLTKAGVLQVVSERRVRAVLERTYALQLFAAQVGPGEAAAMGTEEHRHAFMAFVASLLGDFDRYLADGPLDLVRDGVSYGMFALWVTDSEFSGFLEEIRVLLEPFRANRPGPGRRRRIVANVMMPTPAPPGDDHLQAGSAQPPTAPVGTKS